jgi:hypothetical protein
MPASCAEVKFANAGVDSVSAAVTIVDMTAMQPA